MLHWRCLLSMQRPTIQAAWRLDARFPFFLPLDFTFLERWLEGRSFVTAHQLRCAYLPLRNDLRRWLDLREHSQHVSGANSASKTVKKGKNLVCVEREDQESSLSGA